MGRIVGLDYGTARVGIALSDKSHLIASAYSVAPADAIWEALDRLLAEEEIDSFVVGHPISLSGEEGVLANAARTFSEQVAERTGCEAVLYDERFTTKIADDALIAGGVTRRRRREIRDKTAAAVMLQGYLDSVQ